MMKTEKIGGLDKYEVESDLRSLRQSGKIKGDSKRLKAVGILAKEEMNALKGIAGEKQGLGRDDDDNSHKMSY